MRTLRRRPFVALALVGLTALSWLTAGPSFATNVKTVIACPSSGWDHSDSKPFNSEVTASQYTDDGLKIAVDGPTQKQSGYVLLPTPVALQTVNQADVQLTYQSSFGYPPAYQLTTYTDNTFTTWSGNLVYESGKWWATRPLNWPLVPTASQALGGATLDEWRAAYPNAVIYQVGFSLGSGAQASSGTVLNVTFQGTMWVFKATCLTPTSDTTTSNATTTESSSSSSSSSSATTTTTVPSTTPSQATTTTGRSHYVWPTTTTRRVASVRTNNLASTGVGGAGALVALGGLLVVGGGTALMIVMIRNRRRDRPDA
jgi:hypothetical protein